MPFATDARWRYWRPELPTLLRFDNSAVATSEHRRLLLLLIGLRSAASTRARGWDQATENLQA